MELASYKYKGGSALVKLHEKHLRLFVETWRTAKAKNITLPETDDPDYESMETLLLHLVRSSRGYITWICEKLELPDPQIDPLPEFDEIENKVDPYLNHLLEKWKLPLVNLDQEKYWQPVYKTKWGPEFCIEAMLEHAVMHPIRHQYQLEKLMTQG